MAAFEDQLSAHSQSLACNTDWTPVLPNLDLIGLGLARSIQAKPGRAILTPQQPPPKLKQGFMSCRKTAPPDLFVEGLALCSQRVQQLAVLQLQGVLLF